jgi:hypothetical protein
MGYPMARRSCSRGTAISKRRAIQQQGEAPSLSPYGSRPIIRRTTINWPVRPGGVVALVLAGYWPPTSPSSGVTAGQSNFENHFPAREWVHEVVTYDGGRIKEYTNGQLVNDWLTTGARIGQGESMAVGGWPQFSGYNYRGSIDEFQVFGWALTPQEVQETYERR